MAWTNIEKQRAYDRARYLANREAIIKRVRERERRLKAQGIKRSLTDAQKERVRQRAHDWYHANKERAAQRHRAYRQTGRGRMVKVAADARRRACKEEAPGFATTEQIMARIDYFGGLCSYCREAPVEHLDHAVPLSRGGSNWASNLRPACEQCNLRKWTKTWREFLAAA